MGIFDHEKKEQPQHEKEHEKKEKKESEEGGGEGGGEKKAPIQQPGSSQPTTPGAPGPDRPKK